METPSCFNLDVAVAAWRHEFVERPEFTPVQVRELEAHLRDGWAELRQNQLSDEEAFLVARHRVGPPIAVASEFAKAAPVRNWAPRVAMLALAVLAFQLWIMLAVHVRDATTPKAFYPNDGYISPELREYVQLWGAAWSAVTFLGPIILAGFWLARGLPQSLARLISTRGRVAALCATPVLFFVILHQVAEQHSRSAVVKWDILRTVDWPLDIIFFCVWQTVLIGLLLWLTPGRARKHSHPAAGG